MVARSLRDILERQTSLQMMDAPYMYDQVVAIRGNNFNHGNNHVLFLINGRPFRDSQSGGLVVGLINGMPLDVIRRIEIIRGPGSVLYGSNAFAGVINIITKDAKDLSDLTTKLTYGSFNTRELELSTGQQAEDFNIVAGMKMMDGDGWNFQQTDYNGVSYNFDTEPHRRGAFISADYKGFNLDFFNGRSSRNTPSITMATFPPDKRNDESTFLDIGFEHALNDNWGIEYHGTYNRLVWDRGFLQNDNYLGEVTVQGELTDSLNLLVGATAEHQKASLVGTPVNTQWYSGYAQLDYWATDWLKLVAGMQMNAPKGVDKSYSPRLGAIAHLDDNWGLKLLYGEAFRTGYFTETSLQLPTFIANPNLKPETVSTLEGQIFYSDKDSSAALTFFHSEADDLVARVGFPIQIQNVNDVEFNGIEFDGQTHLGRGFHAQGNATWQVSEDNMGRHNTSFAPNWMAKAGVSYDQGEGITLGLYDSFFGKPGAQARLLSPQIPRNPEPDAYHLMSFNAEFDLNKLVFDDDLPDTALSFYIDNLLDERISFPDINNQAHDAIPNHSGRAFYGTLRIRF